MRAGEDLWGQPHGLTADGYALVPAGGSAPVITNGGGDGIDLADGADVEGVNVAGPTGNGITASNVNDATVGATTAVAVSGVGDYGISVTGGDGNLNFGNTSVTGAGDAVSVAGRTGGTVTFGGPITDAEGLPHRQSRRRDRLHRQAHHEAWAALHGDRGRHGHARPGPGGTINPGASGGA